MKRRPQFSLAAVLGVMTGLCVLFALCRALPEDSRVILAVVTIIGGAVAVRRYLDGGTTE